MRKDDPCIGVCQWDGRTGWCLGCGRTVPEIRAWRKMTPYRKAALARELPRRVRQVAVAQVIRTRLKDGRFADSVCGVVKQPGQFFDVDAYHPSRSDDRWAMATDIAVATLKGDGKDIVPGALFFHSGGVDMPTRTRLAQIADHTFYR